MSKTPLFIKIARPTYGAYLLRRNHIETVGMEILSNLEPPFLVLGNHTHTLDALFISAASPVHIRWVAGAYLFKLRLVKTMVGKWVGGISKQQGRSDFQTIRDISNALKNGEVVGLFPEGTRTWDGEPVGFDEATAKLVRMFKVPVVIVNFEGGYLLKPRWSDTSRKGTVTLRVLPPLMPETIKTMKLAELMAYLQRHIGFSHQQWQQKTHRPFKNKAKAKGLEKVLYICPDCGARSSIRTEKNLITCNQCNMTVRLDEFEYFTSLKGHNAFENLPQWHDWEREQLHTLLLNAKKGTLLFPPDRGVLLQIGLGQTLVTLSKKFEVTLTKEAITVYRQDRSDTKTLRNEEIIVFPFNAIQSMIINAKSTIELYRGEELYRIRIEKTSSILKYTETYAAQKKQIQSSQSGVCT